MVTFRFTITLKLWNDSKTWIQSTQMNPFIMVSELSLVIQAFAYLSVFFFYYHHVNFLSSLLYTLALQNSITI